MESLAAIGRFSSFSLAVFVRLLRGPWYLSSTWKHCWTVFLRCLGPVVAVVFPFGMVMAVQGLAIFEMFGAHRMLSSLISTTVLRELSPVLASVLVAAQGGSSFAAELGSMRIKEEVDATEVMAVDSLAFHVVPRVLALVIATPMLNLAGSVAGVLGGFFTAVFVKGEQAGVFVAELWTLATPVDVFGGTVKTTIFGLLIGLVATYQGYNASGGAAGVGRAVNDTVVYATLVFISANWVVSSALYGGAL